MEAVNAVYVSSGQAPKYRPGQIDSTALGIDPIQYPNTNWLGLIYREAPMTNQTVQVAGGNDLAQLKLSANYFDQQGILNTENYYKRFTTRANTDFNITRGLTANADLMLMDERVMRPNGEGNAQFRALHDTPPTGAAIYEDGTYGWQAGGRNPLAFLREEGWYKPRWRTASVNTGVGYAFDSSSALRGLKIRAFGTADNKDMRELRFIPSFRFTDRTAPTVVRFERVRPLSADYRTNNFNTEIQATADYDKLFGRHATRLLVGYDRRQSNFDDVFSQREGAYNNELQLPGSGDVTFQSNGGIARTTRLVGTFSRFNYGFADKYLLEANIRRDGSSRFGADRKYGIFPSFSAAWRVSEEGFFRDRVGFINDLKLRGSWGRLGNDRIDDYLFQQTININSGNYQFGNTLSPGATPGRIANPEIGWETTEQTNGGIDFELLEGKLSFTGDVYKKLTTGILRAVAISSLVGQQAPTINAASVSNRGWEAALNWRDNIKDFNYSLGFNLSDVKNRVEKLPGGDQVGGTILRVGEPINAIYGVRVAGIFQTPEEVAAWATQLPGKTGPGDLKYVDQNGDGKIDGNDRVVLGNSIPRYTWGSNLTASFKAFDFSILFQGVGKVDQYMDGALIEGPTWENFFPEYLRDSWSPTNTDAEFPRFVFRSDHNHNAPGRNSKWVRDGSYINLKNMNFGYTLPTRLVSRANLGSARIYVAGTNLFTWSETKGLLPVEFNPDASRGTYYYQTKQISIGTSLGM
jgi:TonB-linked SusC/RagA family outer membrane protein